MSVTTYTKPAVRHAWAETATASDLVDPGDGYAEAGWPQSTTPPPRQYFNWVLNYNMEGIRYLCQNGVPSWDPAEEYPVYAQARGSDGNLYQSLVGSNVGNDPTSTTGSWGPVTAASPPSGDSSTAVATTAWVASGFLKVGSTFAAIGGSIANAQVPQGAVTQYEGALSIAFGQLTGTAGNAQIPEGAVTQYQGVLAIGWGQLTGTKNADQLQGYVTSTAGTASTVALRDTSGGLTAATFNVSSDLTFKTDVQPITGALARMDLYHGITYRLKDGPNPDEVHGGFGAQDFAKACPHGVRTGKDGKLEIKVMSVVAELAEALRDARNLIRALEERVKALEGGA